MNKTRFGIEVSRARLVTGTTLKDLGEFTGKGAAYHSGLENRRRKIRWHDVRLINAFFRSKGHKFGYADWYELAKESNNLPLVDLKEELEGAIVFDCPAGDFERMAEMETGK